MTRDLTEASDLVRRSASTARASSLRLQKFDQEPKTFRATLYTAGSRVLSGFSGSTTTGCLSRLKESCDCHLRRLRCLRCCCIERLQLATTALRAEASLFASVALLRSRKALRLQRATLCSLSCWTSPRRLSLWASQVFRLRPRSCCRAASRRAWPCARNALQRAKLRCIRLLGNSSIARCKAAQRRRWAAVRRAPTRAAVASARVPRATAKDHALRAFVSACLLATPLSQASATWPKRCHLPASHQRSSQRRCRVAASAASAMPARQRRFEADAASARHALINVRLLVALASSSTMAATCCCRKAPRQTCHTRPLRRRRSRSEASRRVRHTAALSRQLRRTLKASAVATLAAQCTTTSMVSRAR
mmetsp:Transcript_10315/g.23194  ORF Transcript_10315/g.23194 Transcript_10315/m.23194 type:complete len:365 (-) Transcript_10315:1491-2585(-)